MIRRSEDVRTGVTNNKGLKVVLGKALSMIHHSGTPPNISEDKDGNGAQCRTFLGRCSPHSPEDQES